LSKLIVPPLLKPAVKARVRRDSTAGDAETDRPRPVPVAGELEVEGIARARISDQDLARKHSAGCAAPTETHEPAIAQANASTKKCRNETASS
jgi:hypothetical protein